MQNYDKHKKILYLKPCKVNNWYGLVMSQKLPINKFKWVREMTQFNKNFIKIYNWSSNIFYWSWCSISEKLHDLHN